MGRVAAPPPLRQLHGVQAGRTGDVPGGFAEDAYRRSATPGETRLCRGSSGARGVKSGRAGGGAAAGPPARSVVRYRRCPYLARRQPRAMEKNFDSSESARLVSTHGAELPTTTAARRAPPRIVADL